MNEETPIKEKILSGRFSPEILVAVRPELSMGQLKGGDPSFAPVFVLVYKFDKQLSKHEYQYVFCGARLA